MNGRKVIHLTKLTCRFLMFVSSFFSISHELLASDPTPSVGGVPCTFPEYWDDPSGVVSGTAKSEPEKVCMYFICKNYRFVPEMLDKDMCAANSNACSCSRLEFLYDRKLLFEASLRLSNLVESPTAQKELESIYLLSDVMQDNIAHPSVIKARKVFYKGATGSGFANDAAGNPTKSIDPTKVALLPGVAATTANYTNYVRGLNGIIVDLHDPRGTPTAADFRFARWDGINAAGFVEFKPTSEQLTVSVIPKAGEGGSHRIKLEFANKLVSNTWLRVTVLASLATALPKDDVFYFGNVMGDVTGPSSNGIVNVNILDTNRVRGQQGRTPLISNHFDIDRSGAINVLDTNSVRGMQGSASIKLITP